MNITLDATTIPLLIAGILGIISAAVTAFLTILGAVRQNTRVTIQGQQDSKVRSEAIHVLVNRRLLTALRLVVLTTKRLWEQSNLAADQATYEEALAELRSAEDAAKDGTMRESDGTAIAVPVGR